MPTYPGHKYKKGAHNEKHEDIFKQRLPLFFFSFYFSFIPTTSLLFYLDVGIQYPDWAEVIQQIGDTSLTKENYLLSGVESEGDG